MAECPFCDLDKIEGVVEHAYGSGYTIVSFPPLNPVTQGHRLVVPSWHVEDALAEPHLTGHVFATAAERAREYQALDPFCHFNLITSIGEHATQTVRHLHVHIVPRREGDGLHLPWTGQVKH